MSLMTIVYLIVVLSIYLTFYALFGSGITTIILAIIILGQAILYSFKPYLYDRFVKFFTPKMYQIMVEKDEAFIVKRRKMNTISLYILSVVFTFNGCMQIFSGSTDLNILLPTYKSIFIFIGIAIVVSMLLIQLSAMILRKSKTADDEFAWSLLLGIGLSVMFIGGITAYIMIRV